MAKTKKQFILDTLLPYLKNPEENCAFDSFRGMCAYFYNDDGNIKRCAVGKHLKDGEHLEMEADVVKLHSKYPLDTILTDEAKEQNLPLEVWLAMQEYHDNVAQMKWEMVKDALKSLELETGLEFPELMPK